MACAGYDELPVFIAELLEDIYCQGTNLGCWVAGYRRIRILKTTVLKIRFLWYVSHDLIHCRIELIIKCGWIKETAQPVPE